MHHPFTAPRAEDQALLANTRRKCRARAYDLVINGYEAGGGTIRIHDQQLQQQVFRLLGIDEAVGPRAFRLPLGCAAVRRAAARRDRLGRRPDGDAFRRPRQHPRLHRLSQDAAGHRPDDRRPGRVDDKQLRELGLKPADRQDPSLPAE